MAKSAGKSLSKSEIAATLAEKVGITKKQAVQILEIITDLAYKNAKNSFTLPGLGKLVLEVRAVGDMDLAHAGDLGGRIGDAADIRTGDQQVDFTELRRSGDGRRVPPVRAA